MQHRTIHGPAQKARDNLAPERVVRRAVSAEGLKANFPPIELPIQPPFQVMEARSAETLPPGNHVQFEPKWDGFRCLVFRAGANVALQSKSGQPLGRYFPELVAFFTKLPRTHFVLDGEIVILRDGQLFFDDLLLRIHPAESRIRRLARDSPATYIVFDLLVDDKSMAQIAGGASLVELPLCERRARLQRFFSALPSSKTMLLSPSTSNRRTAEHWLLELTGSGFDGIVAKDQDMPYTSGQRTGMIKIKRMRTADCVVGGFRWASKGGRVGSLLLGLYDRQAKLNHVGFTSSFTTTERKELAGIFEPYRDGTGFTGSAPGGPSRWSTERTGEWEKLKPKLVCEVRYDHFSGGRFRHGTKFLRWRPDKDPRQCTYDQLQKIGAPLSKLGLAA